MRGMKEILHEAETLPAEERAIIIDSLLRTLNPPRPEIDSEWAEVAERRLRELRSGSSERMAGDEAFDRIQKHLKK